MRTLGNVLWVVLAGTWLALGYAVAGLLACLTIVGIPFGIQALKLAGLALWPFGRAVVRSAEGGCLEVGANVVWLVLVGWELFLGHLVAGALLCLTIVGIPFGIQAFKLSVLALWPFGRTVLGPSEAARAGHASVVAVPADPTSALTDRTAGATGQK